MYISVYIYVCMYVYMHMYLYICMNVCACSRGPGLVCSEDRDWPNINQTSHHKRRDAVKERCRMGGTTERRILAGKEKEDGRKLFQSTDITACLIKNLYCKNINMYTYYTVILVINILLINTRCCRLAVDMIDYQQIWQYHS